MLLVEDVATDAAVMRDCFAVSAEGEPDVVMACVDRLARARTRLASERFDVVLLDLSLPDADGLEGVEALCALAPDVPIVVMAGVGHGRLAGAAGEAGAQGYLTKGDHNGRVVRHAVRHAIERHSLRRERELLLAREREVRAAAECAARVRDDVLGPGVHGHHGCARRCLRTAARSS